MQSATGLAPLGILVLACIAVPAYLLGRLKISMQMES